MKALLIAAVLGLFLCSHVTCSALKQEAHPAASAPVPDHGSSNPIDLQTRAAGFSRILRAPASFSRILRAPASFSRILRAPASFSRILRAPASFSRILKRGDSTFSRILRSPDTDKRSFTRIARGGYDDDNDSVKRGSFSRILRSGGGSPASDVDLTQEYDDHFGMEAVDYEDPDDYLPYFYVNARAPGYSRIS